MPSWYDWTSDNVIRPEVSGIAGAFLGLLNTPGATLRERVFNFLAGVSCAAFLAPSLDQYYNITSKSQTTAIAFVVGLLGMNLVAKAIDYLRQTSVSDLISMFRRAPTNPPKEPKE